MGCRNGTISVLLLTISLLLLVHARKTKHNPSSEILHHFKLSMSKLGFIPSYSNNRIRQKQIVVDQRQLHNQILYQIQKMKESHDNIQCDTTLQDKRLKMKSLVIYPLWDFFHDYWYSDSFPIIRTCKILMTIYIDYENR